MDNLIHCVDTPLAEVYSQHLYVWSALGNESIHVLCYVQISSAKINDIRNYILCNE